MSPFISLYDQVSGAAQSYEEAQALKEEAAQAAAGDQP